MTKTLNEVLLLYIQAKKIYLKESTYARYLNLIKNHINESIGKLSLNELSNRKIQYFCDNKLAAGTSVVVIREIVLLIKLAIKREAKIGGYKTLIIDLDLPSANKKRKTQVLTRNEQKTLLEYAIRQETQKYSGIVLSLMTGLRIGELCALKWTDIDLKKRVINVEKTLQRVCYKGEASKITITRPKTSNSIREVPISNTLYDFLVSLKPSNRDVFFLTNSNKYTEPRNYRKIYKTLIKRLKITSTSFHSLRHTFATRLIENKVDIKTVSELLGHSSINITLSTYVHSQFNTKRKAIKTLDSLFLK